MGQLPEVKHMQIAVTYLFKRWLKNSTKNAEHNQMFRSPIFFFIREMQWK